MSDKSRLPKGNVFLTRRIKELAAERGETVGIEWRRSKNYPPSPIAYLVSAEILALAQEEEKATKEKRERARQKKQDREIIKFTLSILSRFPLIPEGEAARIAAHACEIGSGRVGRSNQAEDPVMAAVVAHVRHCHTDYDDLLSDGLDQAYCRKEVGKQISEKIDQWQGTI